MTPQQSREMRGRSGLPLIEMLVVLMLRGLAAARVAPALLPPHHDQSALTALLGSAREVAARRGEIVYLHIDPTGQWRVETRAHPLQSALARGRGEPVLTAAGPLLASPRGSCALALRSAA